MQPVIKTTNTLTTNDFISVKSEPSEVNSMTGLPIISDSSSIKFKLSNNLTNLNSNNSNELSSKQSEQIQLITIKNDSGSSQITSSWECEEIVDLEEL